MQTSGRAKSKTRDQSEAEEPESARRSSDDDSESGSESGSDNDDDSDSDSGTGSDTGNENGDENAGSEKVSKAQGKGKARAHEKAKQRSGKDTTHEDRDASDAEYVEEEASSDHGRTWKCQDCQTARKLDCSWAARKTISILN